MELIDILNGMTPFATLGLIVYLFVQGRNQHTDKDDMLKLELVKLVGAAVQNIEQSTEALKALRVTELETQTLIAGARRELAAHHERSLESHASVIAAVEAVPAKAAQKTDERLAPRFEVVQRLLTTATTMITALAEDVKTRTEADVQAARAGRASTTGTDTTAGGAEPGEARELEPERAGEA